MSHLKNSIESSEAQYPPNQLDTRGCIVTIPRVLGIEPGITLPACNTQGLAIELLNMLRPMFPGAKFSAYHIATFDNEQLHKELARHKDLILSCREADEPGRTYLERFFMRRPVDCEAQTVEIECVSNASGGARL